MPSPHHTELTLHDCYSYGGEELTSEQLIELTRRTADHEENWTPGHIAREVNAILNRPEHHVTEPEPDAGELHKKWLERARQDTRRQVATKFLGEFHERMLDELPDTIKDLPEVQRILEALRTGSAGKIRATEVAKLNDALMAGTLSLLTGGLPDEE